MEFNMMDFRYRNVDSIRIYIYIFQNMGRNNLVGSNATQKTGQIGYIFYLQYLTFQCYVYDDFD